MNIELDDIQLKALKEIQNGSIVNGNVGSGKSRVACTDYFTRVLGASVRINSEGSFAYDGDPRPVVVITTALKRDKCEWEGEFADFGVAATPERSFGGISLTVDSWNNITKYEDVKGAHFILDEQRLVGNGAWVQAFFKIAKHNSWIMLSATPGDVWMDYRPVFIAHGFYKNATDFNTQHVIMAPYVKFPKVDRYVNTGKLLKYKSQILVDMPVARHTKRHIHNVILDYDLERFNRVLKDRWHVYEDRPLRDIAELFLVARKVVNDNPARLEKVQEVLKDHPRLVIFYNFNYELDALRKLAGDAGLDVAEWNGHKHEPVPTSDRWAYLVQYTAGAEGWNCVTTDATVFYSLNYSYKINQQAMGRIDRRNTSYTDLHYYILKTNSMIDLAIDRSLKEKKNFNEKKLGKKFGTFGQPVEEADPLEADYKDLELAA